MATNPYLQRQGFFIESQMIQELVTEAIQWGGINLFYIPRTLNKLDQIYGEDVLSSFEVAIPIEMYLDSVNGFEGENDMIARFGLEIRDSAKLTISRPRFIQAISQFLPQNRSQKLINRPLEGDLIYDPLTKGLFEIRYVNNDEQFLQTGKQFVWSLSVEKYQYNNEDFKTGIDEIDVKFGDTLNINRLANKIVLSGQDDGDALLLQDGGVVLIETTDQLNEFKEPGEGNYGDNFDLLEEFKTIRDFSTDNPFGDEF